MNSSLPMTPKEALAALYQACDGLWYSSIANDKPRRLALAEQSARALIVLTEVVYGKKEPEESPSLCERCYQRRAQWMQTLCLPCQQAKEKEQGHVDE